MMKAGREQKRQKEQKRQNFCLFVLSAFFAFTYSITRRIVGGNVSGHQ
jgi:hypothetical protein